MVRFLIIPLILIVALVSALLYVGDAEMVSLNLLGKTYEMTLQKAILALTICIGLIIGLWSLLIWLWHLPQRVKTGFGRKRSTNGLDALEDALLATETGNTDRARKQARRAGELLKRPALTRLVAAKAAEAAGEGEEAQEHYSALLKNPDTQTVGQHGLARLAGNKGDFVTAIDMAKTAYAAPKAGKQGFDFLLKSQIAHSDWDGALDSLITAIKRKHIDKNKAGRMRAVILCAQAARAEAGANHDTALSLALRAVDASAGFAPAQALAARLLSQSGQSKKAVSLIEKAWAKNPHPALALSYRDIFAKEPEKIQTKKINGLIKTNTEHRESYILAAENALRTHDGVGALQALGGLLRSEEPSARICTLAGMAEENLGNTVDARAWQIRAASAPVEADWSDLDPDGPAFDYTDQDWQRLVISYGESGTLIHPRYEAHQKRRAAISTDAPAPQAHSKTMPEVQSTPDTPPSPDDPQALSERLENLLDKDDKS